MKMTNRERAEIALQRKIPDRVPIFELLIDPSVRKGICKDCSYTEFAEKYNFDIVLTSTPSDNYRMEVVDEKARIYRDEWGVMRQFSDQTVSFPIKGPIQSESDLDTYTPPDPLDPYRFKGLIVLLEAFKGEKLVGMHVHDAFSYPSYLRGMDNLLMDIIENPELVHKLVRLSVDHSKALITKAHNLGAELFVFGDDYAGTTGPMMSPKHFREFFLPGMKEVVGHAKGLGAYAIKHTDGDISSILDMIISTGTDGIHPLDPEAGMDIREIKKRYADRLCVIGNIDTGKLLTESTPEAVEEEVRQMIVDLAPGGGYIIASANTIHSHVKPENYQAMLEAVMKYGWYRHLGTA